MYIINRSEILKKYFVVKNISLESSGFGIIIYTKLLINTSHTFIWKTLFGYISYTYVTLETVASFVIFKHFTIFIFTMAWHVNIFTTEINSYMFNKLRCKEEWYLKQNNMKMYYTYLKWSLKYYLLQVIVILYFYVLSASFRF